MCSREVRFRTRFIQKNKLFRVDAGLPGLPQHTPLNDIWTILFCGLQDFF